MLLSSEKSSAAVVKLVDFGSAQVYHDDEEPDDVPPRRAATATPAYSPPEFLERGGTDKPIEPTFDMWALGTFRRLEQNHPLSIECSNASDLHKAKQA